jgi:hypothetical protein
MNAWDIDSALLSMVQYFLVDQLDTYPFATTEDSTYYDKMIRFIGFEIPEEYTIHQFTFEVLIDEKNMVVQITDAGYGQIRNS